MRANAGASALIALGFEKSEHYAAKHAGLPLDAPSKTQAITPVRLDSGPVIGSTLEVLNLKLPTRSLGVVKNETEDARVSVS